MYLLAMSLSSPVVCSICKAEKPEGEFYRRRDRGTIRRECKACLKARAKAKYVADPDYFKRKAREWQLANPERDREIRRRNRPKQHRRQRYDLTEEQYQAMLVEQEGRCKICRREFGEERGVQPNVDHCHATDRVRGILCRDCNTALGIMRDDVDLLKRAIEYLEV